MYAWPKRLSNVICGDRLSAFLCGCSTIKLHSKPDLQHSSTWLVKKSSWKLQMWNFSCWQISQNTIVSLLKRCRACFYCIFVWGRKTRIPNQRNRVIIGLGIDNQIIITIIVIQFPEIFFIILCSFSGCEEATSPPTEKVIKAVRSYL